MRALRVLGLAEDGGNLVCEDGTSGELFSLPVDERLRASIRGDISRLGQLEIELEPQLRPREIQARIRAGASIADVAAAASTSIGRIERYAYPVLLERSTTAEKARQSHPVIDGNPTRKTLDELVMATLAHRGQDTGVQWDAHRDEDGWVVCLTWQAGRSENHARWAVHPGPRANTLHPKDEAARDLVDPAPHPLRTIADSSRPDLQDVARRIGEAAQVAAVVEPEQAQDFGPRAEQPTPRPSHHPAGTKRALADRLDQEEIIEQTVLDERAGTQPAAERKEAARTGTDHAAGRGHRKGQRPVMPGWEDILLGGGQTPRL